MCAAMHRLTQPWTQLHHEFVGLQEVCCFPLRFLPLKATAVPRPIHSRKQADSRSNPLLEPGSESSSQNRLCPRVRYRAEAQSEADAAASCMCGPERSPLSSTSCHSQPRPMQERCQAQPREHQPNARSLHNGNCGPVYFCSRTSTALTGLKKDGALSCSVSESTPHCILSHSFRRVVTAKPPSPVHDPSLSK